MPKRKCQFQQNWTNEFPCIKRGKADHEAICTLCTSSVDVSHSGKLEIERHFNSKKHKSAMLSATSTPKISSMFVGKVTDASVLIFCLVNLNIFINENNKLI